MYINFWYVAAQSGEVTFGAEKPLKVQMLGHHFALWRDKDGRVRCISDTCSHCGGALADGRIRGDCVECPYHGWTFNGDGDCVRLPSLVGLCHRIQPTFREGMSQINFTARTPLDAYHSRAVGWQARNYLLDPEHDAERMAGILLAVEEDLRVVESVKPKLTPRSLSAEFLTETDGMELAFRKRVFKWASRGWEIDLEQFERLSRDHALVSLRRRAARTRRIGFMQRYPCGLWPPQPKTPDWTRQ